MSQQNRNGFQGHARLQEIHGESVPETMGVASYIGEPKERCQAPLPIADRALWESIAGPEKVFAAWIQFVEFLGERLRQRDKNRRIGFLRIEQQLVLLQLVG